jgi:diguanylate cyclase (GGDEF)-like protein
VTERNGSGGVPDAGEPVDAGPHAAPEDGEASPGALVDSYRRVADIFHHVLSEQTIDGLLGRVADTIADLLPLDSLIIYESDERQTVLTPVLSRTEHDEEIMKTRTSFGEGITGWAAQHREAVLSNRAELDPRMKAPAGLPERAFSLIAVPLLARGTVKGILNLFRFGDAAVFSEEEFGLARWFGDAAAIALDNAQVRARLEHQAQTDSLTGLYNHRHFHDRLRTELNRASRTHGTLAVLMLDIDDFKKINDVHGHGTGDQVLVAVADILRGSVRTSDVLCRIGGEEFAVIMNSADINSALGLARRLTDRITATEFEAVGTLTVSIGIAQGPEHAMNSRELVACAETAMMTAKARGKAQVVVFGDGASERPETDTSARDARSIAHLKMLQSLAGKLNRLNDVHGIGTAIAGELRQLLDYHTCRVYVIDGEELRPVAVHGDVEGDYDETALSTLVSKVGRGAAGHVAQTGEPLLAPDASISDPDGDDVEESLVAVPLRFGSRVIGVILVSKLGLDQFDSDDVRLLEVLAGQTAVSLENARLYEDQRREAENAKALLNLADTLSNAPGAQAIAEVSIQAVARLLGARECSLWLEDDESGEFTLAAHVGYEDSPETRPFLTMRWAPGAPEKLWAGRQEPFVLSPERVHTQLPYLPQVADPVAIAPLPGTPSRGWIAVRGADSLGLTEQRSLCSAASATRPRSRSRRPSSTATRRRAPRSPTRCSSSAASSRARRGSTTCSRGSWSSRRSCSGRCGRRSGSRTPRAVRRPCKPSGATTRASSPRCARPATRRSSRGRSSTGMSRSS